MGQPPGSRPRLPRPDLRPMILLIVLLVAVAIGWLLLSPVVLPPVVRV